MYSKLLSEHLLIPVVLVFVIACEELLVRPRAWGWFVATVVFVWAAYYLRTVGLVLAILGALVIVIGGWSSGRVRSGIVAAAFGAASISVPVLWMIRNGDSTAGSEFPAFGKSSTGLVAELHRVARQGSGMGRDPTRAEDAAPRRSHGCRRGPRCVGHLVVAAGRTDASRLAGDGPAHPA